MTDLGESRSVPWAGFDSGSSKVYGCVKEGRQENGMGVLLERRKKDGYWVANNNACYKNSSKCS